MTAGLLEESIHGRFWFASNPDNVVPGQLLSRDGRPRLELFGALSPFLKELPSEAPGLKSFVPADSTGPQVIYGSLMGKQKRVTIVDAYQREISAESFSVTSAEPNAGLQREVFEGGYAVLGGFLEGRQELVKSFRFRVADQDAWLHHSGLAMQVDVEKNVTFSYALPEDISASLADGLGSIRISAVAKISPPRVAGAYIDTLTWLSVDLADGISVPDAWRLYPVAASVLMTLLNDRQCPPVAFEVEASDGRWCPIVIPGLAVDRLDVRESKLPERALMGRSELGFERFARWFSVAERFLPLAHVVAAAVGATDRTVSNRLLELATAAEGVHRRLHPEARRLTVEQVESAIAALPGAEMDAEARQVLYSALKVYLFEVSYPQRLKALSDEVTEAVPGVTGRASRWKAAVADARIGFAHSLAGGLEDGDKIYELHTLALSLRWLLTGRILLELGIESSELGASFAGYERYKSFLRNAARDCPRIYSAE